MKDIPKDTLIKASNGDREAFEAIYRAVSGFVYSLALRVTRNHADAQEVTQDVFIKIHRSLKSFGFRASFKTWVYRITTNTAINSYRKRIRQMSRQSDFDTAIKTEGVEPTVEQTVDTKNSQEQLMHLLGELNPDQRSCIVLREIEGLSYKEISKTLRININTVRSRLKRARQALMSRAKKGGGQ